MVISPLRPATIVPGHGPVCGLEAVGQALAYLRFIQATAEAGKSAGLSPLQLARETDLGEFASLSDPERIVGNLLGGNARAGLEDTLHLRKGELSPGNTPLVRRTAQLANALDQKVADVTAAEVMLSLPAGNGGNQ